MAEIVDLQGRSGGRPDPEPPRKPAKRRARKRAADKRRPEQRQAERRKADRRRTARRRIDRVLPLLMAVVGLAVGAVGALMVRTQDVTSPPFGGRFALCGNGVWQQCVVDGDTIRFAGATIRLADINAPETRGAQCPSERALGNRASAAAARPAQRRAVHPGPRRIAGPRPLRPQAARDPPRRPLDRRGAGRRGAGPALVRPAAELVPVNLPVNLGLALHVARLDHNSLA